MLNKEQIETEKAYDDCSVILKKFDKETCQFSKDIENLLNVYANAAKNVIILNFVTNFTSYFYMIYLLFSFLARQCSVMVTNAHPFI